MKYLIEELRKKKVFRNIFFGQIRTVGRIAFKMQLVTANVHADRLPEGFELILGLHRRNLGHLRQLPLHQ